MGRKLTELEILAKRELEAYYQRQWEACGENLWPKWPLPTKYMDTLVRASLSHQIGCKGGLVNELGRYDSKYDMSARVLQSAGFIVEDGFVPTKLGWSMLEKFAKYRARFPTNYEFTIGDRVVPPGIPYEVQGRGQTNYKKQYLPRR